MEQRTKNYLAFVIVGVTLVLALSTIVLRMEHVADDVSDISTEVTNTQRNQACMIGILLTAPEDRVNLDPERIHEICPQVPEDTIVAFLAEAEKAANAGGGP